MDTGYNKLIGTMELGNKSITRYSDDSGNTATEVKTYLGEKLGWGVRTIYRTWYDTPERITDDIEKTDVHDVFYPGQVGVIMKSKDGSETRMPDVSMEKLASVDKELER